MPTTVQYDVSNAYVINLNSTVPTSGIIFNGIYYQKGSVVNVTGGNYSISAPVTKGWAFSYWESENANVVIASPYSLNTTAYISGSGSITADYNSIIKFVETGLPANTSWSISSGNYVTRGTSNTLYLEGPLGNYPFTAYNVSVNGSIYSPLPSKGMASEGNSVIINYTLTQSNNTVAQTNTLVNATSSLELAVASSYNISGDNVTAFANSKELKLPMPGHILNSVLVNLTATGIEINLNISNSSIIPSRYPKMQNPIYNFIQINGTAKKGGISSGIDKYVSRAIYNFSVPVAWAVQSDVSNTDIKLFKYVSGNWVMLPTVYLGSNATSYFYSATSNSFSAYVVGVATNTNTASSATSISVTVTGSYPTYIYADGALSTTADKHAVTTSYTLDSFGSYNISGGNHHNAFAEENVSSVGHSTSSTGTFNIGTTVDTAIAGIGANVIFSYASKQVVNSSSLVTKSETLSYTVPAANSFVIFGIASGGSSFTAPLPSGCTPNTAITSASDAEAEVAYCTLSSSGSVTITASSPSSISAAAYEWPPATVTLDDNPSTGTITTSGQTYSNGQSIQAIGTNIITANPPATGNWVFSSWSVSNAINLTIANTLSQSTSLTVMGNGIVTAEWIPNVSSLFSVPITLTNNQGVATPAPFQQMLSIGSDAYSSYINPDWNNVEFTTGNAATGNVLQAWVESNATNTATDTVVWVKLPNGIPASSNTVIYMNMMSANVMSASGPTGEAPQLSCSNPSNTISGCGNNQYGEYDNGGDVFSYYENFAGTSLPSGWTGTADFTGSVDNGLYVTSSLKQSGIYTPFSLAEPYVLDSQSSIISSQEFGIAVTQDTPVGGQTLGGTITNGYSTLWDVNAQNIVELLRVESGSISDLASNTVPVTSGIFGFAWTTGALAQQLNYSTIVKASDSTFSSQLYLYLFVYTGAEGYVQWIRARAYPPDDVMPNVSGLQTVPLGVSIKSTPTAPAEVDAGGPITFNAVAVGGKLPYTYTFYVYNSVNQAIITSFTTSNDYFVFTTNSAMLGESIDANVVVTDGSGHTANSVLTGDFTIVAPPTVTLTSTPSVPATIYAGNAITFNAFASNGVSPYQYTFNVYDAVTGALVNTYTTSSNSMVFTTSYSSTVSEYDANVVLTDSDGYTVNSVPIGIFTVNPTPAGTLPAACSKAVGPFTVNGVRVYQSNGELYIPHGATIPVYNITTDPIDSHNRAWPYNDSAQSLDAQISALANGWCGDTVRLQIAQDLFIGNNASATSYRSTVENAVDYANSLGLVIVLNAQTQSWGYELGPTANTVTFWQDMDALYGNNPQVVYDLFNEPGVNTGNVLNNWQIWQQGGTYNNVQYVGMQTLVNDIRSAGVNNLIWVEGPNSDDSLNYLPQYSLTGNNLVYNIHHPAGATNATAWQADFGYLVTDTLDPVVDGEWSNWAGLGYCWQDAPTAVSYYLAYLKSLGVGMTVWMLEPGVMSEGMNLSDPTYLKANFRCQYGLDQGAGELVQSWYKGINATQPTQVYVPITLTNFQSSNTPYPFQQMLTVNSLEYDNYIDSNWSNVEFTIGNYFGGNGYAVMQSWIESGASNQSTNTTVWVNVSSNQNGWGGIYSTYLSNGTTAVDAYTSETAGNQSDSIMFSNGTSFGYFNRTLLSYQFDMNGHGSNEQTIEYIDWNDGQSALVSNTYPVHENTPYIYTACWSSPTLVNEVNYSPEASTSSNAMQSSNRIELAAAVGSRWSYTWVRARAAPPNCVMPSASFGSVTTQPSVTSVPITITNAQSSNTPAPFQQMLSINSLEYSSYINPDWNNVEFTTGNAATGNVLKAWVESNATNSATDTVVWVKLPNGIPASSNTVIYMNMMSANVMSASGPTGEAPQLSPTYAQYDNGAQVFNMYDNFAGNTLNSRWTTYGGFLPDVNNGITIPSPPVDISADNSITIYMNFMPMPARLLSDAGPPGEAPQLSPTYAQFDNGAQVFDLYADFAGTATPSGWTTYGSGIVQNNGITFTGSSTSLVETTSPYPINNIAEGYFDYTGGDVAGGVMYSVDSSGGPYTTLDWISPGVGTGLATNAVVVDMRGYYCTTVLNGAYSNGWCPYPWLSGNYLYGIVAPSSSQATALRNYTMYSTTADVPPQGNYYLVAGTSNNTALYYLRTRAYPPNGIMPLVSFGSVSGVSVSTCQISLSTDALSFGTLNPGLSTPANSAVVDTNGGSASAYMYVYGGNWISGSNNFGVSNTVWSTTSQTSYTGTPLSAAASNTAMLVPPSGSNTIYFGTAVPASQPSGSYTQNIIIENSC